MERARTRARPSRWLRNVCFAAACSVALFAGEGLANAAQDGDRDAARALGEEGILLYRNGEFAQALERFDKAEALVKVPTLALRAARCLERLGRLVAAAERYRLAALMPVDSSLPEEFQQAQRVAKQEAEAERRLLLVRIPTLTVHIRADKPELVTLDAQRLPEEVVGQPLPVDPGAHVVVASLGELIDRHELTLVEREAAAVDIELHRPAAKASPVLALPAPPLTVPPAAPQADRAPFLIAGISLLVGAGVASSIGVGAWIMAANAGSDLEELCPGRVCDPASLGSEGQADLALQADAKTAMIASFVTAGALTTAGIVSLALMPSHDGEPSAKVSLLLMPTGLTLVGGF